MHGRAIENNRRAGPPADAPTWPRLTRLALAFARDFASFAGMTGVWGAALVGLGALLENIGLLLLIPIIALTAQTGAPQGRIEQLAADMFALIHAETRFARLSALLGVFAVLLIVRGVVQSSRNRILARLRIGFVQSLRLRVLQRLTNTRWDRVLGLQHARIGQVLNGDIDRVGTAAFVAIDCGVSVFMLIAQAGLAFALAPLFAGMALAFLGVATLWVGYLLRGGYDLGNKITRENLMLMHSVGQLLGGLKLAMSQNLQAVFLGEFEESIAGQTGRQIAFASQQANGQLAFTTMSAVTGAACALVGVGIMDMPAPLIIPLLLILSRMSGPAITIIRSAQQFVYSLPAYERLRELEAEMEPAAPDGLLISGLPPLAAGAGIVFNDVAFSHERRRSGQPAAGVAGLNITIKPGEFVGVSGPSGAGKTTFADLLVGLNSPQSGQITIGGAPLAGAALAAWRDTIAYVAQDAFLFHDSIRHNLLWGNPRAGAGEIWSALELAGAAEFVKGTPEGLDTIVGERGTLVSGGERQRLALARAILRRPRMLVLDEATSAIDLPGERAFLLGVLALEPRPAIVIIAHRPESLSLCDRVLVFREGGVEPGPAPVSKPA